MFKKVLVPIDVSHKERNDTLIQRSKELADANGGSLTLLNVVQDVPGYIAAELPAGVHERVLDNTRAELKRLAEKHGLPSDTEINITHGHPAQKILEASSEGKADVVVVASHQPGLADYLLGSVAGKVVRHASCSVVVLR